MAGLVDTNILVYRFDPRFPDKQRIATEFLRNGISDDSIRVPHQAVIEFVAATTRPVRGGDPLLPQDVALREAEEMLSQYKIVYPNEEILRIALRGTAAYQISWFDAHLWAFAEYYGLRDLYSEDFEHGRLYGTVQVINPFVDMQK